MRSALITLGVLFFSSGLDHKFTPRIFVVWDVGQGSWMTYQDPTLCHHIDLGGERNPILKVSKLCKNKPHQVSISHWDWDHYSFLRSAVKRFTQICHADLPKSKRHLKLVRKCSQKSAILLKYHPQIKSKWSKNDQSSIHLVASQILVPGDSTKKMEKLWLKKILEKPKVLILGHHGSNTSTSKKLLETLPSLRQAVASARKRRYGHPHPKVRARLKKAGLALLSTEEWGTLAFELPTEIN